MMQTVAEIVEGNVDPGVSAMELKGSMVSVVGRRLLPGLAVHQQVVAR